MSGPVRPTVLLVDDEPHSLSAMTMALEDEFEVLTAGSAEDAGSLMQDNWVQAIFCDQRMPGKSGVEFLTDVRDRWPECVRIIITGYTDTADMISAINDAGIYQFLTKPWHPDQLLIAARNATALFQLMREHERLSLELRVLGSTAGTKLEKRRARLRETKGFEAIVRVPNSPMNPVIDTARHFATFDVPVLLTGEPGTGKAELARAMHLTSLRSDKPFYALDCAGLTDDLIELELFGARRGAVAAATVTRIGLAQKADRGTLFLNGVDTLSPRLQLCLLRLARDGSFQTLGGTETLTTNMRLIAGSGRDLRQCVAEGSFRGDLYFALSLGAVDVPPLRARRGDVAHLAQACLVEAMRRHGKLAHGIDEAALEFLENYDWPGNMRELENEVTRMLIFTQGEVVGADVISRHILQAPPSEEGADRLADVGLTAQGSLKDRVELMEMRILRETLTRLRWNKSHAAAELGLSRVGLRAKLDRYGIDQRGRETHDDVEEED